MNTPRDVAVIVGSLRKDSLNRKLAKCAVALAPPALALEIVEIGQLPLYNQDDDANYPSVSLAFKARVSRADAVLFVTPEYNRSMPGVFKNALDVGSRPNGQNAWDGKPGAIASVSPGAAGAFGATHHLRQTLVGLNVAAMPQPEMYLGRASDLFGPDGAIANDRTRDYVAKFLVAFSAWIDRFA